VEPRLDTETGSASQATHQHCVTPA